MTRPSDVNSFGLVQSCSYKVIYEQLWTLEKFVFHLFESETYYNKVLRIMVKDVINI